MANFQLRQTGAQVQQALDNATYASFDKKILSVDTIRLDEYDEMVAPENFVKFLMDLFYEGEWTSGALYDFVHDIVCNDAFVFRSWKFPLPQDYRITLTFKDGNSVSFANSQAQDHNYLYYFKDTGDDWYIPCDKYDYKYGTSSIEATSENTADVSFLLGYDKVENNEEAEYAITHFVNFNFVLAIETDAETGDGRIIMRYFNCGDLATFEDKGYTLEDLDKLIVWMPTFNTHYEHPTIENTHLVVPETNDNYFSLQNYRSLLENIAIYPSNPQEGEFVFKKGVTVQEVVDTVDTLDHESLRILCAAITSGHMQWNCNLVGCKSTSDGPFGPCSINFQCPLNLRFVLKVDAETGDSQVVIDYNTDLTGTDFVFGSIYVWYDGNYQQNNE